jgi:hypothetical protein
LAYNVKQHFTKGRKAKNTPAHKAGAFHLFDNLPINQILYGAAKAPGHIKHRDGSRALQGLSILLIVLQGADADVHLFGKRSLRQPCTLAEVL